MVKHAQTKTERGVDGFLASVDQLMTLFGECCDPLKLTKEIPEYGVLRFLDLKLKFIKNHVCWEYHPRACKPLLPFHSTHLKLVKRAIAGQCLGNALKKSCFHSRAESFQRQGTRLVLAGYPDN